MPQFIEITDDGERITSKMPPDETVVVVKLKDGQSVRAFYTCDVMESGDWDFLPVGFDGEPIHDGESLADQVVAWRPQFDTAAA